MCDLQRNRIFLLPILAEREGFEPPEPCSSTVFKTAAIDHSAIFPSTKIISFFHSSKLLLTGTEQKVIGKQANLFSYLRNIRSDREESPNKQIFHLEPHRLTPAETPC